MPEPKVGEWPWLLQHNGHPAWYQRSLLIGDFAPGRRPIANYVLMLSGQLPEPYAHPVCGTCGVEPKSEDMLVVERATGDSSFFASFRSEERSWSRPTNSDTCWYCNGPMPVPLMIKYEEFATVLGVTTLSTASIPCCPPCTGFVRRK